MNKQQARNIIRETFENPFDKGRFTGFIKNLLNRIDEGSFIYQGTYIPEKFRTYIKTLERIGKFSDSENSLDILVITLQKETSLERARTMQRNFISWYLNGSRGGEMKDAALVAYVSPEQADWRFSLVKMDYKFEKTASGKVKVKEEFTPARRWSFLVGANEKSHTAQSRLVKILANDEQATSLKKLEEGFNIETVTKEFFLQYRELFLRTKEALDVIVKNDLKVRTDFEAKGVDTVNFAKKLLGQIVFLYFLQKKGWFGVGRDEDWGTGSKHFLRSLFDKKHGNYINFFNDILEPLFYEALRIDRSHDDDYYSRFNCKIPFLNGGLFDPIGNYDWVHTDINLPNELFANSQKTREGDIGDGILDVFDRYNFTVREDEPLEKEVAIDPELLGKTYEKFNAIRPDNFDEFTNVLKSSKKGEENKFNKKFGVYYTPREIVHYMCQQSLINYLYTQAEEAGLSSAIKKQDMEDLIEVGEMITEHEATALIKQERIKSGIQKSSEYTALLSESIRNNAVTIDQWLAEITVCDPAVGSGAFPVGMMNEIVRARNVLSVFLNGQERNDYQFKRRCIEHSIYGVDIDPGAVEIAKLRLWLSLVVDEKSIKNIKPLPNLDYKIVCGNSLLGYPYIPRGLDKIEELKKLFFDEVSPKKKEEYREQINEAIFGLLENTEKNLGYPVSMDFKINFSEVFRKNQGFDIVMANPPYIQLQKLKGNPLQKAYKDQNYEAYNSSGDVYCLFYEKGIDILKPNGHLVFITSNKWMRAAYGEKIRQYFLKYNPLQLIDLGSDVFESATVDTNILIVEKSTNQKQLQAVTLSDNQTNNPDISSFLQTNAVTLSDLTKNTWFIGSYAELKLKEKIERVGKALNEWNVHIHYGIKTGLNEAFIIDTLARDQLVAKNPKCEGIIRPILSGRDIKRYDIKWADKWLLATGFDVDLTREYPEVYQYLLNFEEKARNRDDQGRNWWNLRACAYYSEFENEKIVWGNLALSCQFAIANSGYFINAPSPFINCGDRYLLGVLNSTVADYYIRTLGVTRNGGYFEYKPMFVEQLPVPIITSQNKNIANQIEILVDQIMNEKRVNLKINSEDLEKEINKLVYQLYDLSLGEIAIVEGCEKK